jgi:hypothetical protein
MQPVAVIRDLYQGEGLEADFEFCGRDEAIARQGHPQDVKSPRCSPAHFRNPSARPHAQAGSRCRKSSPAGATHSRIVPPPLAMMLLCQCNRRRSMARCLLLMPFNERCLAAVLGCRKTGRRHTPDLRLLPSEESTPICLSTSARLRNSHRDCRRRVGDCATVNHTYQTL